MIQVAVFLYDEVELLDFAGPGEVFAVTEGFRVYTVAATRDPIVSQGFVTIRPEYGFDDAPPAEIVVLPGGTVQDSLANPAVLQWLRATSEHARVTMSVCTGAYLLAAAGLLEGRSATTWHGRIDHFREFAKGAEVLAETRFVDNGTIVTTAGVSAGIDGALHVVERLKGVDVAAATARYMEYDHWQPGRGVVLGEPDA